MTTVVLIRCTQFDEQAARVASEVRSQMGIEPIFVPDCLKDASRGDADKWPEGAKVVKLDQDLASRLELFTARERIGWLCGDYVLYAALSLDWDYAWVIETDVSLIGAQSVFNDLDLIDDDLLACRYTFPTAAWEPYGRLKAVWPDAQVASITFPLVRVSRRLAEAALGERQRFTRILEKDRDLRVPNDESVIASVAREHGFTVTDLLEQYPEVFRFWRTVVRFPLADLARRVESPKIVHSAVGTERFLYYVEFAVSQAIRTRRLLDKDFWVALSLCSEETFRLAVARIHRATAEYLGMPEG